MAPQLTYLAVNTVFFAVLAVICAIAYHRGWRPGQAEGMALIGLAVLTAIFDNLIIAAGIVAYDETLISGVRIVLAPIEDFAYTVAAVFLMSVAWHKIGR